MTPTPTTLLVATALMLASATPARAQFPDAAATAQPRGDNWQAVAGVRTNVIRSGGLDPFSDTDAFPQFSLAVSRVVFRQDRTALALGLSLDTGSASDTARGTPSELALARTAAFAEARWLLHARAYAFARGAGGWLHGSAALQDFSSPSGPLVDGFDTLALDASAGAAAQLTPPTTKVGVWLLAEGGYGWAASHHLMLAPELPERDQNKAGALDLGNIAPRGGFFRFSLALTY